MHLVSLQQAAGVEAHFAEFVRAAAALRPQWRHGWLNPARTMHPFVAEQLGGALHKTIDAKHRGRVKLPSRPAWFRAAHCRRELRAAGADALLIWNRSAKIGYAVDALGADRCVHWEHGAAWDEGRERDRIGYFARVRVAIANSNAAARYLQLRWNYSGEVHVCLNALRPSLRPRAAPQRSYPPNGAIKLGVAARLYPVKGVALVLHALKALRDAGLNAQLDVAGAGPQAPRLQALAQQLGVAAVCRFHGALADMRSFYASVDCLVHPPITEAFGLVAIEAAAHGCPVIAAQVDGLPEAVADGVGGYCVEPTLPLHEYVTLGGALDGLPKYVYDPVADRLHEPRVVDPAQLAAAVRRLFADAHSYETMSRSASDRVARAFDFSAHVTAVLDVVDQVARRA